MCFSVTTWAPVLLNPAVVMETAFSQHAMGAVWERGEEASGRRRLQARSAVGARGMGCWTRLWKRHQTGAASRGSYRPSESDCWKEILLKCCYLWVDLPRNCTTLVRVLLWAALVLGRRVPCPSDTLSMSKHTHTYILQSSVVSFCRPSFFLSAKVAFPPKKKKKENPGPLVPESTLKVIKGSTSFHLKYQGYVVPVTTFKKVKSSCCTLSDFSISGS